MTPNTIRLIDKYAGRPVCFLLTVLRHLFPSRKTVTPKSILFLKLVEQGATVLAFSAMERAVNMVGRENVYFCVFKENRPILDIMDMIPEENVFEIRHSNPAVFLTDVLRFIFKARKKRIDGTVDMEFFSRAAAILAYLSGARNRVGLHRFKSELPYRGDLMTHRVQYNPYLPIAKGYLLLVEALEKDTGAVPMMKIPETVLEVQAPEFSPSNEEISGIRTRIEARFGGSLPKPLILLNPNASDMLPLRKWPTERFIALGDKLFDAFPHSGIILTGAFSEQEACNGIRKRFGDNVAGGDLVVNMAGSTTLRELLVLYSVADLLITNDSGPGHFASMTNIKTIVMFGPETPLLFAPLGENIHILWKNLTCSPCVNALNHRFSPCTDNVCMQEIGVEEVFDKACELLKPLSCQNQV